MRSPTSPTTLLPFALAAALMPALPTVPALADEVWDTAQGQMVYLEDIKDTAVWGLDGPAGTLRLYLPGLAGNFGDRSVHEGYWIASSGAACGSTLTGPDGFAGGAWGRLTLAFDGPAFPSHWTLLRGSCLGGPDTTLRGLSPLLADGGPVPGQPADDACGAAGLQGLVGTPFVPSALPAYEPQRVHAVDDAVTMDHNPQRRNVVLSADRATIVGISCG